MSSATPPSCSARGALLPPRRGPRRSGSRLVLLLTGLVAPLLFGSGCLKQKALIRSDPPGAELRIDGAYVGVTPSEVEIWNVPFSKNTVQVKVRGQRTVELRVKRWRRKSEHEVVFVRRHGRAGTWTPEEAEE